MRITKICKYLYVNESDDAQWVMIFEKLHRKYVDLSVNVRYKHNP